MFWWVVTYYHLLVTSTSHPQEECISSLSSNSAWPCRNVSVSDQCYLFLGGSIYCWFKTPQGVTFLADQWLRICLGTQRMQIQSLAGELRSHTQWNNQALTPQLEESLSESAVKNLPAMQESKETLPGSGRSLGGGNGNPLQYSCLGNATDRGAWRARVQRAANSWTQLSTHLCH